MLIIKSSNLLSFLSLLSSLNPQKYLPSTRFLVKKVDEFTLEYMEFV